MPSFAQGERRGVQRGVESVSPLSYYCRYNLLTEVKLIPHMRDLDMESGIRSWNKKQLELMVENEASPRSPSLDTNPRNPNVILKDPERRRSRRSPLGFPCHHNHDSSIIDESEKVNCFLVHSLCCI